MSPLYLGVASKGTVFTSEGLLFASMVPNVTSEASVGDMYFLCIFVLYPFDVSFCFHVCIPICVPELQEILVDKFLEFSCQKGDYGDSQLFYAEYVILSLSLIHI